MIEQAAEWAALLDDDAATPVDHEACMQWCAEHPLHKAALEQITAIGARFEALDPAQRQTIVATGQSGQTMKRIGRSLACLAILAGASWYANQTMTVRSLWPDHRTGIGEQRILTLADGSRIVADTGTRFDEAAGSKERSILLFEGQVMARVARDPRRLFVVETAEGRATALGTVFSVKRGNGRTVVTVVESRVRLCPARAPCRTLAAGQRAAMTAHGITGLTRIDPEIAALWTSGWIEVHDIPVSDLLAELQRYRSAQIRYDRDKLGAIRVTGSFPLNPPDEALRSIIDATGLRASKNPHGVISIEPPL